VVVRGRSDTGELSLPACDLLPVNVLTRRRAIARWSRCSASYVSWQRGTARIRPPHAAAAARLLLRADRSTVQQSIDISWPSGPQQQTRSSGLRRLGGADRRTDGRPTDT